MSDTPLILPKPQRTAWSGQTLPLARGAREQFYGAGMQNGRGNTTHRDKTVEVAVDYNWDDGGHPNSVPFYLSSAGYGVFRNTFAPGTYELTFHVGDWLAAEGIAGPSPRFLDQVPIRFGMAEAAHYHVPLLVSPYGYSTYRGS